VRLSHQSNPDFLRLTTKIALVADIFLLDSKFENQIYPECQRIGDGFVTAGIDDVLQARLHEQSWSDGPSVV
jgi:hypothetical protein